MSVSAIGSCNNSIQQTQQQHVAPTQTHQVKDADGDNDGDVVPETQATQSDEDGRGSIINLYA